MKYQPKLPKEIIVYCKSDCDDDDEDEDYRPTKRKLPSKTPRYDDSHNFAIAKSIDDVPNILNDKRVWVYTLKEIKTFKLTTVRELKKDKS